MQLEMSFRVVQSPRKAALDAVDMPGTACHGTEVSSNLSVCVLVAVEVPLSCFADATVTGVWLGVSVDVLAGEKSQQLLSEGRESHT
tara:strand:- start:225 stop:485 length:261 start_codon:yes stop_codon:yes gene_type:complete